MEFEVVGWPGDDAGIDLDYREFSYAGKFVGSATGTAVARDDETIVAAASFNADRTDAASARIRTVTVRTDRQGEGIGSRLLAGLRACLLDERYDRAYIATNNPHAYQAAYRAGFGFTGERSGLAELVLVAPIDVDDDRYVDGLDRFASRNDLPVHMRRFVEERRGHGPPSRVDPPSM